MTFPFWATLAVIALTVMAGIFTVIMCCFGHYSKKQGVFLYGSFGVLLVMSGLADGIDLLKDNKWLLADVSTCVVWIYVHSSITNTITPLAMVISVVELVQSTGKVVSVHPAICLSTLVLAVQAIILPFYIPFVYEYLSVAELSPSCAWNGDRLSTSPLVPVACCQWLMQIFVGVFTTLSFGARLFSPDHNHLRHVISVAQIAVFSVNIAASVIIFLELTLSSTDGGDPGLALYGYYLVSLLNLIAMLF